MSDEIERLLVRVEANAAQFEAQMKKINKALYGSQYATQQALRKIKSDTASAAPQLFKPIGDSFKREMAGLASGLAAVFTTQQVVKYADAYTSLQNRLKATGLAGADLKRVEDSLYDTANRNGIAVAATAELYQRATMARDNLGASEKQLLALVSGTSAALKVQGTSAGEASGALLQLGQLLGGTNVQAQEYNSLIDQMPVLLQAVANGSDRFGGSINNLTKQVKDGKVSSKEFFNAALVGLKAVEQQAGTATVTVGSALQTLNNELGRFVGQTDASLSATERMAQAILWLAENLDTANDAVVVAATVIGTTLASRAVGSGIVSFTAFRAQIAVTNVQLMATAMQSGIAAGGVTRLSVAGTAGAASMRGLSAAMAFFGGPVGLAITGLAAGIAILAVNSGRATREAKELADEVARQAQAAGVAAEETAKLKGEITSAQTWAAGLTGEVNKLADAHFRAAAGAKAQAIETARLRLEEANKTLGETQDAFNRRRRNDQGRAAAPASAYVDAYGRPTGEASLTAGQRTVVSPEFANVTTQTATVRALTENLNKLMKTSLADFVPTAGGGGGGDDPKKPKGAKGPSEEDLARQRQLLALQGQIELLRAQGNDDAARSKQRELDVLNLTKQLSDAGVANAKDAASAHVGAVAAAEDAARGLAILWEGNQKAIEQAEEGNRRSNDLLLDRLGYEAELARLRGDPLAIRTKERELWIEERINALLALRPGLSRDAARGIAEGESGALDVATRQGERNDQARNMARDFVDVLDSDNWAEAAGRKFRDAAFDNLEDLLATLFSGVMGQGGAGGNSIGSIIGSALRNIIPGFSAGTRSAPGGPAYVHKGEVLTNLPKGTSVIPAHAVRAMGALAGRTQVQSVPRAPINPVVRIDLTGANGDRTIRYLAAEAARQAYAEAVATSSRVVPAQQAQRQRYSRG